jgi:N-carbamoylputrescine amidase
MSTPHAFTLGLLQMSASRDPEENLAKAAARIREAAAAGAQVICLPELFRSRYFCQREDPAWFDLAETIPGPTTESLAAVAREAAVVLVVPVFEKRGTGLYHNSLAAIDADGRMLGVYRKMHIPDDPCYYEKYYFAPGDRGFAVWRTRHGRVGTLICWDQWYPEAARLVALRGADVIVYPTAIGWHPAEKEKEGAGQLDAWRTVQRGHAIANGVYVAAVNRVGLEKDAPGDAGIEFWGASFACDPQGVIVAAAATNDEATLLAPIDPARIESVRRHWPFLRDRRVDAYGGLAERFLDG